jgi:hypothetical protein
VPEAGGTYKPFADKSAAFFLPVAVGPEAFGSMYDADTAGTILTYGATVNTQASALTVQEKPAF